MDTINTLPRVLSPFLQKAKIPPKPVHSGIYIPGLTPGASVMAPLRSMEDPHRRSIGAPHSVKALTFDAAMPQWNFDRGQLHSKKWWEIDTLILKNLLKS